MDYTKQDSAFVLHSYKRNPTAFTHGSGAVLYADNVDYIDFMAGIAVCSVGHANPRLASAIATQANKLLHVSNLYTIPAQAALAQRLVELSGLDARCFFCNSGAEANEAMIKIARKFGEEQNRYKIITLKDSFHGRTLATLRATGQHKMHKHFGPYPDGFMHASSLQEVHKMLDSNTCAVMLELVRGEGGINALDRAAIVELSARLREQGALLLVDEVQTGVFRTGEFLASQIYGISPDVVSLAKGLAGGVPIGAVITRLKDIFEPGDHGSTFGGNPLSTTAALCVLDILQEEQKSGRLAHRIALFHEKLGEFCGKFPKLFSKKVGIGLMCGLVCASEELQQRLLTESFNQRVLILRSGADVLRFVPPLTISDEEINEGFKRFEMACKGV